MTYLASKPGMEIGPSPLRESHGFPKVEEDHLLSRENPECGRLKPRGGRVDVITHHDAILTQKVSSESVIHQLTDQPVVTIMEEQAHRAKVGQSATQDLKVWSTASQDDLYPTFGQCGCDETTDVLSDVDAGEPPGAVPVECGKNRERGMAIRDSRLDDQFRPGMADQTVENLGCRRLDLPLPRA